MLQRSNIKFSMDDDYRPDDMLAIREIYYRWLCIIILMMVAPMVLRQKIYHSYDLGNKKLFTTEDIF